MSKLIWVPGHLVGPTPWSPVRQLAVDVAQLCARAWIGHMTAAIERLKPRTSVRGRAPVPSLTLGAKNGVAWWWSAQSETAA